MSEIPDDLMRELLKTFHVEAAEHVQTLNKALLKLERLKDDAARQELVQNAFRAAHSLKGAARAVDLQEIESLAHSLESVLQQARDTGQLIAPRVCDVLYTMLDGIQASLRGQSIDVEGFRTRLAAALGESLPLTEPAAPAPAADSEIDSVALPTVADETIRISVTKLDELMAQTGELLISKINSEQRLSDLQAIRQNVTDWPSEWREIKTLLKHLKGEPGVRLQELLSQHYDSLHTLAQSLDGFEQVLSSDSVQLGMVTSDLQNDVRRARMLPFQTMALSLERTVRDAARTEGKQVALIIEGGDVEIDKKVLETLKDPLIHLLRNAVSHGIENPSERESKGKPIEGQITLLIRQRGSEVSLTVRDDGRGFDLAALRQARPADAVQNYSDLDDTISLAFLPGVTTAHQITAISGRGVGLDVVRQRIEEIHGRIAVNNVPGEGVAIELIVPSSVTMMRGLVVRVSKEHYVLPLLSIERIIEIQEVISVGGKQLLRLDSTSLPLVPLAALLERPIMPQSKFVVQVAVIIRVAEQRLAVQVDEVLSELELAIKPLGEPLRRVRNIAGAALLGSGQPIVILNPGELVRTARGIQIMIPTSPVIDQNEPTVTGHILVVDDSITTRTLEKNILEAAGYRVTIAVDGVEALKRLKENTIDLVVSDMQMPNMDGIALTRQIRQTDMYRHLPVILVTSLESQEDREKGMLAGADAYIVKRGFNQANLLMTINQFLERAL